MIVGMTMVRKTITLPEEVLREVEKISDGNFSAFTVELLERAVRRSHLRAVVDELVAEHGPITPEERERARAKLWEGFS